MRLPSPPRSRLSVPEASGRGAAILAADGDRSPNSQFIEVSNYHILFHRRTPWQSEIRCSTNIYAQQFLAAGYDVSYMAGIVHLGHLLTRRSNYPSWQQGPRMAAGAWTFTPASVVPFTGRGPLSGKWAADWSYRSCFPSIPSLVARSPYGPPDAIWTARLGSSVLKQIFPGVPLILQVVDYYPAFCGPEMIEIERQDYQRADWIFPIGHALMPHLVDRLGIAPEKIAVLGQGVDIDRYRPDLLVPEEIRDLPHPRAIWVGVCDKADPELFGAATAEIERRGGSTIAIGPESDWLGALAERHSSLHWLGSRSPEVVPNYLCHADIGLMLYNRQKAEIYRGQNPLKLYEYAAAGLAILSTPHDEFESLKPPVLEVRRAEELPEAIERALGGRQQWQQAARDFARTRSWTSRFQLAEAKIRPLLAPRS